MVVDVNNPANKLLEARYSAFGIPSVVNNTGSLSAIPFGFARISVPWQRGERRGSIDSRGRSFPV
jgi:hypothetical protein